MKTERPSLTVAIDLRLTGYRRGGIARYASELAAALNSEPSYGITVHELRSRRVPGAGGRVTNLRTPPHHRFEPHALPIELRLRGVRPDVYHAVDFIAPRMRTIPVVATVHDLEFLRRPDDLAPDALAWYRRLESSRHWTDRWIVPSRWTAGELIAAYGVDPARVAVVPHGVPTFLRDVPARAREERSDFVLAVGTVEPRKRLELLLDTLPRLPEPLRLVVAGSPGWRTEVLQERLMSTPRVEWRQEITDEELRVLYTRAIAFVIPSWSEGFGLAALEAMACETPVISSGGGALAEVTGEASLVPEPDAGSWAAAITRLVTDRAEWTRLAAEGKKRAAGFTWSAAAERTAAVYRETFNGKAVRE